MEAIQRMNNALEEIEIIGVPTTIPLHREIMRDKQFIEGTFDTGYLNEMLPRVNLGLINLERFAAVVAAAHKLANPQDTTTVGETRASKWRIATRNQTMTDQQRGW